MAHDVIITQLGQVPILDILMNAIVSGWLCCNVAVYQ